MSTKEIKGNLARLLATENLIVEHRSVPTAMFDVETRVLTLPTWDKASDIVFDLLVGHEVGHALFTPNEDWTENCDAPKDFVNVIEDARIEKLMKRKYPGLKKSFSGGYKELNDMDFFGILDQDLSEFSLIDRINLHFKCGADALIPFSIEEKVFVARTDLAETFEEVLQIANDVYQFGSQEDNKTEIPFTPNSDDSVNPDINISSSSDEQSSTDTEEGDDQQNSTPQGGGSTSSSTKSEIKGEEGGEEWDDEWDDEDFSSSDEGGETSETQNSFDRASEKLSSRQVNNPIYVEIPEKIKLDDYVVDWTRLHDWIDSQANDPAVYEVVDFKYAEFRKQSQKEVNYLVKEFECRKSADAYARAGQSKTGVLDTTKLHTYKYNDDIFKKITVLPDGKNHGLLFLLDWSGSMVNELLPTVKQLLNLTSFCKKVQIPFEVYAFTNDWIMAERAMSTDPDLSDGYTYEGITKNTIYIHQDYFHLLNVISSRSNSRDYERMCKNLFREASYYRNYSGYSQTVGFTLSGTPLNEAIIMMNHIVPAFKQQNDLQKVNVCILSDGDACSIGYGHEVTIERLDSSEEKAIRPRRIDWHHVLRDRKTGRTYEAFEYDTVTNILIQQLRDRNPEVNVIGFRILAGNYLSSFVGKYANFDGYSEVQKQWKKEKSAIIPNPISFTALYAISNKSLDTDVEFDVETGAKKGDISRAFKKMLKNKSTNKKMLNSFIEYVS